MNNKYCNLPESDIYMHIIVEVINYILEYRIQIQIFVQL